MEKSEAQIIPQHIKDLQRSGLSDFTIRAAGIRSIAEPEAAQILGFNPKCGGLVLPYPTANGKPFFRIKPDVPYRAPGWKKPAKYLSPRGAENHLYIPPTLDQAVLLNIANSFMYQLIQRSQVE